MSYLFFRLVASELVQYFQFDQNGNMFVFRLGSGFSGPSVKVEPGFDMQEVQTITQELGEEVKSESLSPNSVFEMPQVSEVVSSIEAEIVAPTPSKR